MSKSISAPNSQQSSQVPPGSPCSFFPSPQVSPSTNVVTPSTRQSDPNPQSSPSQPISAPMLSPPTQSLYILNKNLISNNFGILNFFILSIVALNFYWNVYITSYDQTAIQTRRLSIQIHYKANSMTTIHSTDCIFHKKQRPLKYWWISGH